MKTLRLAINLNDLDSAASRSALEQAAAIIRSGGLVAFPTETVYGLGANALDEAAAARIFQAKQRPAWDPLIVHVCDDAMLARVSEGIPDCAERLMKAFWPGPLTLLLPKHQLVPGTVTAGRERIGVRMPAHPVALELIRKAGLPIAAPSANIFGHVSPTSAAHVLADLDGRIDAVLDAGDTQHGLESTVVDVCESPVLLYRPGVITLEQIAAVCGGARAFDSAQTQPAGAALPSPGLGLRHYAPRARLVLINGEGPEQREAFARALTDLLHGPERGAVMLPDEFARSLADAGAGRLLIYRWGSWRHLDELGHRLFAGLRELDAAGAEIIVCPLPPACENSVAIRDRLQKAAR